ncbi:NAD kinase [Candidatus Mycobacterium methanotrophicum]|uniref:NAD kinase n=1 Tax=Candidatus Mycobacterium methanotrophicum TaxID=2943498 RepID=A0ABY4QRJ2_9MYCO|nr:NAD kinase [Candidatus Mycobacterium methanotrophicum]UQX12540.1 NAD kinase [Candidatus Mycobacterium methanotrophicum]
MKRERTVLLVVHTGREEATDTARRVEKVLGDNGIGLRVLSAEAVDKGPLHLSPDDMRALGVDIEVVDADPNAADGCELVVGLGGDGTFLRAAELARNACIPVLGVNLGRIGFLAEAEAGAIDTVLEHVVARSYRVDDRLTLDIAVQVKGEVISRGWALNDASLEKGPRLGVLGVVLEVDGRPVSTFGCDGVLVSTPTGSTAYAFSAGGPVLWPDLEALLVVPNNAHALFARPMVTTPDAAIAIEIEPEGHDAIVFCDGRRQMLVPAGGRLEVQRCEVSVKWARLDSAPFTDRLVRKFRLPVTGWRGR